MHRLAISIFCLTFFSAPSHAQLPSIGDVILGPVLRPPVGGGGGSGPVGTVVNALPLPKEVKRAHEEFEKGANNVQRTIEKAGNDVVTTVSKAGGDVLTTVTKAGGDTIATVQKAGSDTVTTVEKAGKDVAATYEKGWRDTTDQAKRSFDDAVDAGKALARFTEAQAKAQIDAVSAAERRVREGKVVDALWGAAVEPVQASEKNFAKAAQESDVINGAAQIAATTYGGPAGAAAYAAWFTYKSTGDANLALRAGALSIVTSYAGGSVANMPAGTAGQVLKKAAVTGAVAGIAAAAAGGDEKAVQEAVLKSGGAVLVQGASSQLKAYAPEAHNAMQAVQCISARDVDCLSNTTYAKDAMGKLLYDKNGRPRIDATKLDPKQYVGQFTGLDPSSVERKRDEVIASISKIPQRQAIPVDHNRWVLTWVLDQKKQLELNKPAIVLTYVGKDPPFKWKATYHSRLADKVVTGPPEKKP